MSLLLIKYILYSNREQVMSIPVFSYLISFVMIMNKIKTQINSFAGFSLLEMPLNKYWIKAIKIKIQNQINIISYVIFNIYITIIISP